jgi:hypothetical protein
MYPGLFKEERILLRHNQLSASPPLSQGFSQGKCHAALIASRGLLWPFEQPPIGTGLNVS